MDFNALACAAGSQRLAPDRAESLAGKRLVNINLWRGVRPVENMPLAVCDARSVEKSDFMNVRFGEGGPTACRGLCRADSISPTIRKHRWYYYPDMQPDEVLAFRLFDTGDPDWRMTAHTAFVDPTSVPGRPSARASSSARSPYSIRRY